jgi:preprotein translocase SecF subunit
MFQIFKETNFNFIGMRKYAITASVVILAASLIALVVTRGPNMSIDFTGGTLVQLKFEQPVRGDLGKIRQIVGALNFGTPEVKTIGQPAHNEIQITVKKKAEGSLVGNEIQAAIQKDYPDNHFELRRQELVGPKIGDELKTNALLAVILSLIALLIYVGFRFAVPFGVAAIVPLFHDVLVTLSFFFFLDREISLATLAALLTIAGYSLNDTIVVFDRIRENMRGGLHGRSFADLINNSINQTLSRTIITSLTTLFVVAMLFFLGGESIKDFSLAMLVGTIAGTYSTIYIASPILIWWHKRWAIVK